MLKKGMLGRLPLSAVRGPVDALYDNLASADGERVLKELKKFNRREPCWLESAQGVTTSPSGLLVARGYFTTVIVESHDPIQFYRDRTGLFVGENFKSKIVAAARAAKKNKQFKEMLRFELVKSATGDELLVEFPQSVWEAGDLCSWLAQKLSKQPNGEPGEIANDNWTFALVRGVGGAVLVVHVYWLSVSRSWNVYALGLSLRWDAGDQFISRN